MSVTIPSTPTSPQPEQDGSGVLEHIDPRALIIETNVRTEQTVTLDPGFVDSIRANGVLVPVLAWRATDGGVHVRAGQRRTLATREAGAVTIPVYVVEATEGDTAGRIVEQLVENEHRQALTDTDRVAAWQQLTLEGLSAAVIAKRTGTKREQVTAGITVESSSTGPTLLGEGVLTLDQAAALVEFEDDPEVLAELTAVAGEDPDYLPVAMQRARNERVTRVAVREAETAEAARGHRVLDAAPGWYDAPYALTCLTTADGEPVEIDSIAGREGIAAHVSAYWDGRVTVRYYLDDPEAFGLTRPAAPVLPPASGRQDGPMSEEAKPERRLLIARNKEWDAAATVRAEWLTGFLARKTLPKNTTAVLAVALTGAHSLIAESMSRGSDTAKTLLGVEPGWSGRLDGYLQQHPGRAMHVALAVALGGIEQTLTRNTWRSPSPVTAAYLNTLAGWGYPLCPVERIAALIDTDTGSSGEVDDPQHDDADETAG